MSRELEPLNRNELVELKKYRRGILKIDNPKRAEYIQELMLRDWLDKMKITKTITNKVKINKKMLMVAVLVLITAIDSNSQQNPPHTTNTNAIRVSFASEAITVDNTAGGIRFTLSAINPPCTNCDPSTSRANAAVCTLETGDIRVQTSGVTVTSSVGMYITAGQSFTIYGYNDINAFRAIRVTGTSGTINCTYYR